MSLTISPFSSHASLVANTVSLQSLSVSIVTANLRGEFWELGSPTQVQTLSSACHYLETVGGEEEAVASCRTMIQAREAGGEPESIERMQFSTLRLVWSRKLDAIRERFPEDGGDPVAPSAASSVADPIPLAPPPPQRAVATLFASTAAAAMGSEEFFPPLWWDLSQPTRWGLKHIALGTQGRSVSEQTQDDETHAQFLESALTTWFSDIKDALADAENPRVRDLLDRLAMATEVLEFFRREERRATPLGRAFWKGLSEKPGVRAATRPIGRLQSALEEDVRIRLSAAIAHTELGVVESLVMPLYEGELPLPPTVLDVQQGAEMAQEFSKHLQALPTTVRTDLDDAQMEALRQIDSVLRAVGRKMGGDPNSAYAVAFFQELSGEIMYLAAIVEMIRLKLRRNEGTA